MLTHQAAVLQVLYKVFAGNKSLDSAIRDTQGQVTGKAKERKLAAWHTHSTACQAVCSPRPCPCAAVKGQVRGAVNENKVR